MSKKRGKKTNNKQDYTDPERFDDLDVILQRQRLDIPRLPTTERADTFGLRASCGAELLSFAAVDDDYTF